MKKTALDYVLIVLSIMVLAVAGIYLFAVWQQVPDMVPLHFNLAGNADSCGPKGALWGIYGALCFLVILCVVMTNFPQNWNNKPKSSNPANRMKYIQLYQRMLELISVLISLLFTGIIFFISKGNVVPNWFLFSMVGLLLLVCIALSLKAKTYQK